VLSSAMLLKLCICLKFISTGVALEFLSAKDVKLHNVAGFSCYLYYISIVELITIAEDIKSAWNLLQAYITHKF
jgi:hypothetical protein